MTPRNVRLPDAFYVPRLDAHGREVRDVMPWEDAVSYATDGRRIGVHYRDGHVEWLGDLPADHAAAAPGDDPVRVLAEDFEDVDLDALVSGLRAYVERHPVLRTVWVDDLAALETLRRRSA